MKAPEFLNHLRSQGRWSFSIEEAENALQVDRVATLNALSRLKKNKLIVSPAKSFYLIMTPEYQVLGCLPAEMFISDLMKYWNQPYYVSFLSAAQFYGAAHQKPQALQVVTLKNRRPIRCGRVTINFISNQHVTFMPTRPFNTLSGTMAIATPEVIALDILSNQRHAAGMNNIATILLELAENLNAEKLAMLAKTYPETFWLQRLGYLLEVLGQPSLADAVLEITKGKTLSWIRLVPSASSTELQRNEKWKIIVNFNVEPDDV